MSVKNTINIYCVLYVKTYNKYNIYAYPEGDDQFFKCMISMLYSCLGRSYCVLDELPSHLSLVFRFQMNVYFASQGLGLLGSS